MNFNGIFDIGNIDHYAVHVYDIEKSQDFHVQALGFSFVKSYQFKTSDDSETDDTFSVVLEKKHDSGREVCVLNAPLNDKSFLNLSLQKHGEGIHHVAYSVNNIDKEFKKGIEHNICFTSDKVIYDTNNNLKQVFIDKKYTGYFIELIQRGKIEAIPNFSNNNIRELIINTSRALL